MRLCVNNVLLYTAYNGAGLINTHVNYNLWTLIPNVTNGSISEWKLTSMGTHHNIDSAHLKRRNIKLPLNFQFSTHRWTLQIQQRLMSLLALQYFTAEIITLIKTILKSACVIHTRTVTYMVKNSILFKTDKIFSFLFFYI